MLRADLIGLVQFLRIFLLSSVGQAFIQIAIVSKQTSGISTFHQDYWRHCYSFFGPLFDRAIVRGELSPHVDSQLIFEMLLGTLVVRAFLLGQSLEETLPEAVVDVVLAGVRAD